VLNVANGANAYVHPNHSGDVTSVADGAQTIAANAVSDSKLRDSAALSVVGRSANSSGDPADIAASAASGAVLRESGSALGFGTVATAGIADAAITNAKLANMAQGTVKIRAAGAGTGPPTDGTLSSTAGASRVPVADANGTIDENYIRPSTGIGMFVTKANGSVQWVNRTAGVATGVPIYKTDGGDMVFSRFGDTQFPTSPADGQWCTRTDLGNTMFEYCSAKSAWLSVNVYEMTFGKRAASVASGSYFDEFVATGSATYTSTYGYRYGFDVIVVGIDLEVGASSTCTITVEDDGADVTGGAISLSSQTAKQDETLLSSTIAAGSAIGVKCTSGTATTFTRGKVRFRRIAT
jgi:hypothetical protein